MALDKQALNAVATRGMGHLDERKAQELSNTAWALATAHVEQEPPTSAASSMALDRLGESWILVQGGSGRFIVIEIGLFRLGGRAVLIQECTGTSESQHGPLLTSVGAAALRGLPRPSPLSLASTAWACVTSRAIGLSSLHATARHLFSSKVDEGVATMAIWTLSQLDDVTAAFQLVDSAAWKIPPLSLSPLLSRCEQEGLSSKELRVLSFLAHDEFQLLTEEVMASRLRVTGARMLCSLASPSRSWIPLRVAVGSCKSCGQGREGPSGAETMSSNGPEVLWEVSRPSCPIRAEPHFNAEVLRWKRQGDRVSCIEMTMDGWLKIADDRGWMISDMQGLHGIGEVLSPKRGEDVKLAVEEPHSQGVCCLEIVYAQVAVRSSPSRDAVALYYRRKGELVFARSQNFGGWLRLAGEEGWMLANAPEHGTLLRVREVTANADLWSLSDLWAAVRRKRRMLSPTDVRSLKDAEEGTLLMADMDYEHHVKTGNAECLVEDGLLLKEDLKKPDDWIRQRLFAYSLLRMAKEEPPLNELCPGDFKLTPRPPPMDLFKKITLEEVQGEPKHSNFSHDREEKYSSAKFGNGSSGGYGFGHGGHSNGRGAGNNSGPGFFKQHDFSLGGHRDKGPPNRGRGGRGSARPTAGKGRSGKGMKGMGKGFGGMMDGMGGVPGLDGVMSVDINGREYLMTQEGLVFDPDTQMPFGVLHPETGEVVEITEEMLAGLSQMAMVELNGRPYLFVGGFLVDPQTQAVAFQVEQDGTVLDALTGEPCGMLEMDEEPVIRATSSSNKAQSQKSSRPGQSRSAFSFEDEAGGEWRIQLFCS
eukprot:s4388_g2.t1